MMSWMGSMIGREEGELDMSGEWGLGLGLFGRRLRLLISAASGRFGSRSPSESEEEAVLQDTLLRFMGAKPWLPSRRAVSCSVCSQARPAHWLPCLRPLLASRWNPGSHGQTDHLL